MSRPARPALVFMTACKCNATDALQNIRDALPGATMAFTRLSKLVREASDGDQYAFADLAEFIDYVEAETIAESRPRTRGSRRAAPMADLSTLAHYIRADADTLRIAADAGADTAAELDAGCDPADAAHARSLSALNSVTTALGLARKAGTLEAEVPTT